MLFYLALNELPLWMPAGVILEMVTLALVSVGGIVGLLFLGLIIEAYDLDPPQRQLQRLLDRGEAIIKEL